MLFLVSGLTTLVCYAQVTFTDAIAYNDYIVNEQNAIGNAILELSNAFNEGGDMESYKTGIFREYEELKLQCNTSLEKITIITPYDNNSEFLEAALNLFTFYKKVIANEYYLLINFMTNENATIEEQEKIMSLMENMSAEEARIDNIFLQAQQAFANKYGFTLSENELQDDIDELGGEEEE